MLDGVYRPGADGTPEFVEVPAPDFKQTLCVDIDGFSLHAAVRCGADDRQALEQLCRTITRPALAPGQRSRPDQRRRTGG